MEIEYRDGHNQSPEAMSSAVQPVDAVRVRKFLRVLQTYKEGKTSLEQRIQASEQWWKLRNTEEGQKETQIGKDGSFTSRSGWLHNVIVSKHADAMESYPEANMLPREPMDREEAKMLSSIVPCILEQNQFEETYSDVAWQKMKFGTGLYKVLWDKTKHNGLGDISILEASLLNVYWEPGVKDIQKSRYVFHTELADKDVLEEQFPELQGKLDGQSFISTKFLYDDHVPTENKATVIEVYYHKWAGLKKVLHYCRFVGETVLFATENMVQPEMDAAGNVIREPMAQTGLYDHGLFPYVFDPLFPVEGSPCGYGFVDICRNPQLTIDILKTSFVKNAMAGATPRYWSRNDGGVNEKEFLDLSKAIVHANNINEDALRPIEHNRLDGMYVTVMDGTIQELRETSGNTETATGNTSSGVTAAAAIAALQEASGKGSRDSTKASYRAFSQIVNMVIELMRQFYDLPRQFRITGQYGEHQFTTYTNAGLKPQHQGEDFGQDMGFRLPVFDIKVSAQKKNVYTKVSQNELALQFFQMGFFNPQMVDQAMMCLDMMEFDGKDEIMQKVAKNGQLFQKLIQYMQMAMMLAQIARPDMVQGIMQDLAATMGQQTGGGAVGISPALSADPIKPMGGMESTHMNNARSRSAEAAQPQGGKVIASREEKK